MKKRSLLILAHYYAPDVASTGQILQELAEALVGEYEVTVLCAVPSYDGSIPKQYRECRIYRESLNNVSILRVPVTEFRKDDKTGRIRNLYAYWRSARKACRVLPPQDIVFAISQPPILGGMLGVYAKRKIRSADGTSAKLVYCIQDFNPEQIEAIGYFCCAPVLGILRMLDKRSCRESNLVITVGRDLASTFRERFRGEIVPPYTVIHNWVDEERIRPLPQGDPGVSEFRMEHDLDGKFVFLYSGNIGLYYDLEGIIRVIRDFRGARTPDGQEVVFVFVGTGAMLGRLKSYQQENELDNVRFLPYQDKDRLVYCLNSADVHLCVNAQGIKGVSCPSKFYGIAAVGKPLLGVLEEGAEIRMLIEESGCGRICTPGDYGAVRDDIRWFIDHAGEKELAEMGRKGRQFLEAHLSMQESISRYRKALDAL